MTKEIIFVVEVRMFLYYYYYYQKHELNGRIILFGVKIRNYKISKKRELYNPSIVKPV
jgi:hypothetical protein